MSVAIDIEDLNNEYACIFVDNASIGEIVDFVYENYKEDLCRELNIKSKNDLYFELEKDNSEDAYNCVTFYAEKKISNMKTKQLEVFIATYID